MATFFFSGSRLSLGRLRSIRSEHVTHYLGVWRRSCAASAHAGGLCLIDGKHPLIDIMPILQPDHPERTTIVRNVGVALRSYGYFYAQNVDSLPSEYMDSIYKYSRAAHALPLDVKRHFVAPEGASTQGGSYSGLDVGAAEDQTVAGEVASVRAWNYSRYKATLANSSKLDTVAEAPYMAPGGSAYPSKEILEPDFVEVLDDLYERQNKLASALMTAFAEMFELPLTTFSDMFSDESGPGDLGTIRLLSYPGNPEKSEEEIAKTNMGISAHTDFEAFTLMHQDSPGLQFMPTSEEGWIDAPVRLGEFVVVVGDALERLTNGVMRATPHRVLKTPWQRMSIIRFNALKPETVLQPLPQFVSEAQPAAYSWVTMGTHMETTQRNLAAGLGAWNTATQTSATATYQYIDGVDHRLVFGLKSVESN